MLPEVVALLEQGHTVTLRLRGNSMRPFLEDNRDKALLTLCSRPKVGEPVLAEVWPGRYVFHRIVDIRGDDVTLRGDGNYGVERCKVTEVKAVAIGFYRKGRTRLEKIKGLKWRAYSLFWMHTLRLRPYMLAAYRRWLRLKACVSGGRKRG